MPRSLSLAAAADRHRRCAAALSKMHEEGEACYLIGLAAECAIKHHLEQVRFPTRRLNRNRVEGDRDPIYVHFPELATQLFTQGDGIIDGRLLARLADPNLLQGWTVRMRYQQQTSTPQMRRQYGRWVAQTDGIFEEVGL